MSIDKNIRLAYTYLRNLYIVISLRALSWFEVVVHG